MTTAIVCTALLGALIFGLGARTSKHRRAATDQVPNDPADPLFVAIRAHGNAAEHNPMLAILILLIGSRDPATWMLVLMGAVTACRYAHAIAVIKNADMTKLTPLKMIGAGGTFVGGLALCVTALIVI